MELNPDKLILQLNIMVDRSSGAENPLTFC